MDRIPHRIVRSIWAGVALTALPVAVQAQVIDASYRPVSKAEAILGAPSALAALLAQQSGQPAAPAVRAVSPASKGALFRPAAISNSRPAVSSERPDIFNSVALTIGRSPLDARWGHVAHAGVSGTAAAFAASLRGASTTRKLEAVNAYVNARVRFVDDRVQFGTADRWLAASETLARGRGDCEDYAIAKRAMLRAAGFVDKDLYLVVLKDLTRRADHAVLVVRAAGRFLVLDNGTDRIVDSSSVQDYRPVLTFTAGRTYTHGYRRDLPPITYAAYESPSQPIVLADARFEPASGEADFPEVVRSSVNLVPSTVTL
ncbi:MAG: transglutaminase-like cysteine peptidase [Sphingomonas sp.]|uniref:transglutaminase-like cysteine peptidase n=1 Tax=Sphingomonas sp. TaxID=28214 RepID=UPI00180CE345|nr:transglutaminase-like cysteine peptidase [Sphingomonas sp.]MBA3667271.1 transglutaminase-like cysteine peptidase [Sphingomonas sp.]